MVNLNLSYVYLLAKNEDTGLYLIEKPEHTFKYTLNLKWSGKNLRDVVDYVNFLSRCFLSRFRIHYNYRHAPSSCLRIA